MNKCYQLLELHNQNKLSEANVLFEEIIKEKIALALEKKKEGMNVFSENDVEKIKVINKKQKNRLAVRAGRSVGAISAKHTGRNLFRTMEPNQLKAILATEGVVKVENKKHKKEIERRVQRNLEKSHGGGGGFTGRTALKLFPSSTSKALSKKGVTPHWTQQVGFYRTPVTEDKNPTRIKNSHAEKILKKAGFAKIRSGEHQSIWKHLTDKSKRLFPLPHHSKELSPGLTRELFSLVSEEIIQDILNNTK